MRWKNEELPKEGLLTPQPWRHCARVWSFEFWIVWVVLLCDFRESWCMVKPWIIRKDSAILLVSSNKQQAINERIESWTQRSLQLYTLDTSTITRNLQRRRGDAICFLCRKNILFVFDLSLSYCSLNGATIIFSLVSDVLKKKCNLNKNGILTATGDSHKLRFRHNEAAKVNLTLACLKVWL